MHMVASPYRPSASLELMDERRHETPATHAQRVAQRDRAAVDIDPFHVQAELPDARDALARERLVELDQVKVLTLSSARSSARARGRDRAEAHHRGSTPATAVLTTRASGARPSDRARLGLDQHDRGRAIVDAGAVAGRDGAAASEGGLERRQRLGGVSARGCSSRSTVTTLPSRWVMGTGTS